MVMSKFWGDPACDSTEQLLYLLQIELFLKIGNHRCLDKFIYVPVCQSAWKIEPLWRIKLIHHHLEKEINSTSYGHLPGSSLMPTWVKFTCLLTLYGEE